MKVICTQENFKKAVLNTEKATGKQNTLPVLGNIMIETEKGRLKFSATNLEIGVICKIGAKIEKEGSITVPGKILGSFVGNLPANDKISLSVVNQTLSISSGNYQAKIKGLSNEDFPIIPKAEDEPLFSLDTVSFRDAAARVLACVAPSETRIEFTGINMILTENQISLAATDSFRLAEAKLFLKKEDIGENYSILLSKTQSFIVPASTIFEVIRVIGDTNDKLNIIIEESQIFFQIGDVQIVSRLINGKYPDYSQIIPEKFKTQLLINKDELARAIRISSTFTSIKAGEIMIKILEKGEVVIESQSQDSGENKTTLTGKVSGPEQEIILNPRYLLDGINTIPSSQVVIVANDESAPVGVKIIDEKSNKELENYIYIVMPIKK